MILIAPNDPSGRELPESVFLDIFIYFYRFCDVFSCFLMFFNGFRWFWKGLGGFGKGGEGWGGLCVTLQPVKPRQIVRCLGMLTHARSYLNPLSGIPKRSAAAAAGGGGIP